MIKIITPEEVQKLPPGSKIREHTLSRYGYPISMDLLVSRENGKLVLTFEGTKRRLYFYEPNDNYSYYELLEVAE